MDDLDKYIADRKKKNAVFARNFDKGYKNFSIGAVLKMARKGVGLPQEQVAMSAAT